MRTSLRRVLERLRAATNGAPGKRVSIRGARHEPGSTRQVLVPVRSGSRR